MITKNTILCLLIWVFILTLTCAYAGEVKFTTYYPAPHGEYKNIKTTDNTYLATSKDGKVGIGPTDAVSGPSYKLHLLTSWPTEYFARFFNTGDAGMLFGIDTTTNRAKIQGDLDNSPSDLLLNPNGGNIGIGDTNPDATLEVSTRGFWVATGAAFMASSNNNGDGDLFIVKNAGNVGVGTNAPKRRLHISDVMRLEPRSSEPSNPSEGDIYVNSTNHNIYCYLGTGWRQLNN